MARPSQGWRLHQDTPRGVYYVRFTHNGRRVERSTGSRDPEEAPKKAALIYADFIQREPAARRVIRNLGTSEPLEELVALWLASDKAIAASTRPIWMTYSTKWCARWKTLIEVTDADAVRFLNDRLGVVLADTVRHERGALQRFLDWCTANGHTDRKFNIPYVSRQATGNRHPQRRRTTAPELSPEEIEAMIALLPEWGRKGGNGAPITEKSKGRFPVRARARVAYETGLRPSFIDIMEVPTHYCRGATHIRIRREDDKNQMERAVKLTQAARDALDSVCPAKGRIFGKHDYRTLIRPVAKKVLPPEKAAVFTMAHFRSASATHTLELTGNVPGAMHQFGWKRVDTASRYTKPSQRAGDATIEARERIARGQRRPVEASCVEPSKGAPARRQDAPEASCVERPEDGQTRDGQRQP